MRIIIRGHNLPGTMFRNAGVPIHNVHVAVQVRDVPEGLVRGDATFAEWAIDVRTSVDDIGTYDFKGPAVHGKRGERFVYLTWGDVNADGGFAMFRRAKLMLADIDSALVGKALETDRGLVASIDLTDGHGCPRCARVNAPALIWSLQD
jgi:Family of unknown function (DUF5990)